MNSLSRQQPTPDRKPFDDIKQSTGISNFSHSPSNGKTSIQSKARQAAERNSIILEEDLDTDGEIKARSTFQYNEYDGVAYRDGSRLFQERHIKIQD